jgi:uncharacterized protein (TIGR00730 family)
MNIVVYLGSNEGHNPIYKEKVEELGTWIGKNGHTLVYGGSNCGLMGRLAAAVQKEKGKVIGVEPGFFIEEGFAQRELTELIVTKNMSERKQKMIQLGEAFIAFPGGVGTLEEVSEVMTLTFLDKLNYPVMIYNLNGYYDKLLDALEYMAEEGFLPRENLEKIHIVKDLEEIEKVLQD